MNCQLNVCSRYFFILTGLLATIACGSESDLSLIEAPSIQDNELRRVPQKDQKRFEVFEHRAVRVVAVDEADDVDIEPSDVDSVDVKPVEPIVFPANGYCCNISSGSVSKTPQSGCSAPNNWYQNLRGCLSDPICGKPFRNCFI